eukprot:755961-Hanusia_phi.AAC.14
MRRPSSSLSSFRTTSARSLPPRPSTSLSGSLHPRKLRTAGDMENLNLNDMASLLLDSPGRSGAISLEQELERGLKEEYHRPNFPRKTQRAPSRSNRSRHFQPTSKVFPTEVEVMEARVNQVMKSGWKQEQEERSSLRHLEQRLNALEKESFEAKKRLQQDILVAKNESRRILKQKVRSRGLNMTVRLSLDSGEAGKGGSATAQVR